jgi:hypothetical protein
MPINNVERTGNYEVPAGLPTENRDLKRAYIPYAIVGAAGHSENQPGSRSKAVISQSNCGSKIQTKGQRKHRASRSLRRCLEILRNILSTSTTDLLLTRSNSNLWQVSGRSHTRKSSETTLTCPLSWQRIPKLSFPSTLCACASLKIRRMAIGHW